MYLEQTLRVGASESDLISRGREASQQMISQYWFTPDFKLGLHHFLYFLNDVYCLPHTHGEYHITLCLGGEIEYRRNGRQDILQEGDLLVINPREVHQGRYGTSQSCARGVTFLLSRRTLVDLLEKIGLWNEPVTNNAVFLGTVRDSRLPALVEGLLDELRNRKIGYEMVVQCGILQMLVYLFRHCLEPRPTKMAPWSPELPCWQMVRTIEYMNHCGKSDFSLAELCKVVASSPSRFIRLFKNSTNVTPQVYYDTLLVDKAQMLLQPGQSSIKETAYTLGFRNVSHFQTFFRRISGMTPDQYRRLQEAETIVFMNQ